MSEVGESAIRGAEEALEFVLLGHNNKTRKRNMGRVSTYKITREAPKKMTKKQTSEYYLSVATPFKSPDSTLPTDCLIVDVCIGNHGYCRVRPPIDGGSYLLHNIILDDKIGGFSSGDISRHLCHTPKCINPDHLVAGTHADNAQDKIDADRSNRGVPMTGKAAKGMPAIGKHAKGIPRPHAQGEKSCQAILTEAQVLEIRRLKAGGGWTCKRLGIKFGVTGGNIDAIINRKSWKHI